VTSLLELAVAGGVLGTGIVVVLIGLCPPAITMLANKGGWHCGPRLPRSFPAF